MRETEIAPLKGSHHATPYLFGRKAPGRRPTRASVVVWNHFGIGRSQGSVARGHRWSFFEDRSAGAYVAYWLSVGRCKRRRNARNDREKQADPGWQRVRSKRGGSGRRSFTAAPVVDRHSSVMLRVYQMHSKVCIISWLPLLSLSFSWTARPTHPAPIVPAVRLFHPARGKAWEPLARVRTHGSSPVREL